MDEKITQCLLLQDELNKKINNNWKEIRTEEDFFRAIWLECAEAVESLPWKWWKKTDPDLENVEIELVDIFHFILSISLLKNDTDVLTKYLVSNTNKLEKNYSTLIILFENIARSSLERDYESVLRYFSTLVNTTVGFEKLFLLYVGKNILNKLRQEYGYNKGTYSKTINGVEDNKYLLNLVKDTDDVTVLEMKLREVLTSVK